jgi:hypothetical protein
LLLADVERDTGELHGSRGDLGEARAAYVRALELYSALGAGRDREEMSRRIAQFDA